MAFIPAGAGEPARPAGACQHHNCNVFICCRRYTEFSVEGGAAIHLTGYYMPEYEMGAWRASVAGAASASSAAAGPMSCRRRRRRWHPARWHPWASLPPPLPAAAAAEPLPLLLLPPLCCCSFRHRLAGGRLVISPACTQPLSLPPLPSATAAGDEEDSDDEEGPMPGGRLIGYDEHGMPVMADEYNSEEDSDYDSQGGCVTRAPRLTTPCIGSSPRWAVTGRTTRHHYSLPVLPTCGPFPVEPKCHSLCLQHIHPSLQRSPLTRR